MQRWTNTLRLLVDEMRSETCIHVAQWPLSSLCQQCYTGIEAAKLVRRELDRSNAAVDIEPKTNPTKPWHSAYEYIFHGIDLKRTTHGRGVEEILVEDGAVPSNALRELVGFEVLNCKTPPQRTPFWRNATRESNYSEMKHSRCADYMRKRTFYAGGRGTWSPFHVHTAAINVLMAGTKLWLLSPPSSYDATKRYMYSGNSTLHHRVFEWLLSELDYLTTIPGLAIFVQRPGDVVFIPHFWLHAVINLEYSAGVAFSWKCGDDRGCRYERQNSSWKLAQEDAVTHLLGANLIKCHEELKKFKERG